MGRRGRHRIAFLRGVIGARAGGRRLEAAVVARVKLHFDEEKAGFEADEEYEAVFHPLGATFDPSTAHLVDYDARDFAAAPPEGACFVLPRAPIDQATWWRTIRDALADHLYRARRARLLAHRELGVYSRPNESDDDFRARVGAAADAAADAEAARLADKYATRIKRARDALAQKESRLRELNVDVGQRRTHEVVAGAGELLSSLLSGRLRARSLGSLASRRSMTRRSAERLHTAQERLDDATEDVQRLEEELADELETNARRWEAAADAIETLEVDLEKNDIVVDEVALVWMTV